ncbi:unnamed protein product [Hymenolepis diminuta]|uniref:Uncharacterized protein n=1 Tax=Hymenolepis diminuta TaxID=6216 RepID=A0A564YD73_HYMDI|nr:unnamed protein product [Hymenolepis diminuta]
MYSSPKISLTLWHDDDYHRICVHSALSMHSLTFISINRVPYGIVLRKLYKVMAIANRSGYQGSCGFNQAALAKIANNVNSSL